MIEKVLKIYYEPVLIHPLTKILKHKISPNTITIFAGLIAIFILPALWLKHEIIAVVLILITGYCDIIDGALARFTNSFTDIGCALDIVIDRVVEFIIVLSLWSVSPMTRSLYCILMLGSMLLCITSFLVVGILTKNNADKSFYYSTGMIERAEAFIFFILMVTLPSLFSYFAAVFISLVTLTAIFRLYEFYKNKKS